MKLPPELFSDVRRQGTICTSQPQPAHPEDAPQQLDSAKDN